jgi:hydrogenase assembly chaperone HypC/HupF
LICINPEGGFPFKLRKISFVRDERSIMCLAIPMRVVSGGELGAWCEGRGERRWIDLTLIGVQPQGAWLVAFRDVARQVLSADEAHALNLALDGLEAALRGETADLDAYFPDLVRRAPEIPGNLQSGDGDSER